MKAVSKVISIALFFSVLVTSCAPVTAVPLVRTTSTLKPTFIPAPPKLTPTPQPSITIGPTPTSSLPTSWSYELPKSKSSAYKLKPWTKEDYAFFVHSMNEGKLFDSSPHFLPVFHSFYGFEYFLHTNQVNVNDETIWTIAQMSPVGVQLSGMRRGEEYFSFLVERLLNEGHISTNSLSTVLKSHGFNVVNTFQVKDFYGKGDNAFFFDVLDNGVLDNIGAVFVIRHVDGIFQVHIIKEWTWMFGGGLGRDYSFKGIVDTNSNGFPELVLEEYEGHSGRPTHAKLTIRLYEWDSLAEKYRVNSFDIFSQWCDEGACDGKWEVRNTNSNSLPNFVIQEYWVTQAKCPHLTVQRTYRWDGNGYPLRVNVTLPASSEKLECLIDWAETVTRIQKNGWQNNQAIQIILDALNHWPKEMDADWGPASRDYFQLRLGIWMDLRGESDEALKLLEPLAKAPFIAEYSLPSRTAGAYLRERKKSGIVKACHGANKIWQETIQKSISNPFDYSMADIARKFFGFASDLWWESTYNFSTVCAEDNSIYTIAQHLNNVSSVNPGDWFTQTSRSVYLTKQEDFDSDGLTDWLIIARDSEDNNFSSAWFFFGGSNKFSVYKFDDSFDNVFPNVWQVLQPDENNSIYLTQMGKSIWAFSVNHNKEVETLINDFGATSIQINQNKGLKIKVSVEDWDYKGEKVKDYVWDFPSGKFVTFMEEYDFDNLREDVEQLIFQQHDYQTAISKIQQFFAVSPVEYQQMSSCDPDRCEYYPKKYYPYMYYLMGTAYEMSGYYNQAVRTYYILWRDFPESPYALLAQYKLEPINP